MNQNKIRPKWAKKLRNAAAWLFVPLIFAAYGVLDAQTTHVVSTATQGPFSIPGNNQLRNAFQSLAANNDIIQIGNGPTGDSKAVITFLNTGDAIYVSKTGLTLQGWNVSDFADSVSGLSVGVVGLVDGVLASKNSSNLLDDYKNLVSGWKTNAAHWTVNYSTDINALSVIQGNGVTRSFGPNSFADVGNRDAGDDNKFFSTSGSTSATASQGNGFSVQNLRFDNVKTEYKNWKYVNGLIGNHYNAGGPTSLGEIAGNAFTNLDISLRSHNTYPTASVVTDPDGMYLAGGGVIGVRSTGDNIAGGGPHGTTTSPATATMGAVSGNIFDSINITTTNYTGTTAWRPGLTGESGSAYLEGGGLVGVNAASSPSTAPNPAGGIGYIGHAKMDKLTDNYFTNIRILSNDILLGGGLVGLNNNSKRYAPYDSANPDNGVYALLPEASGNIFGNGNGTRSRDGSDFDIKVEVGYSIRGGGVLGMNGLSAAEMIMENLTDNAFAGIFVKTGSYVRGGGIVGLQTNDLEHKEGEGEVHAAMARLENASGNLFLNQKISVGSYLHGGGVIGLRSNEGESLLGFKDAGGAPIVNTGGLVGNVFKGIDVAVGDYGGAPNWTGAVGSEVINKYLYGGGIVGVSGYKNATLSRVEGNYFDDLTVNIIPTIGLRDPAGVGELFGGGFIGVDAYDKTTGDSKATIGLVKNNQFLNTTNVLNVNANFIRGGGIVGATDDSGTATILEVTGNTFGATSQTTASATDGGLQIKAEQSLLGGGVIGVWADKGGLAADSEAVIEKVENNTFRNIKVTTGTFLEGGGIIGARSDGEAYIGTISRNDFTDNVIEAGTYLDGGGIIGVTGKKGSEKTWIDLIDASTFVGNTVTAKSGDLFGGLVYSYGLDSEMTIQDSLFRDNTFSARGGKVYGAVTIDTGADTTLGTHTLNVVATNGKKTVFNNNAVTNGIFDGGYNSLYFGTMPNPEDGTPDFAANDAKLVIDAKAGGIVALYDPIWVNQQNSPIAALYTFDMEVKGDGGNFIWGGENIFKTDGPTGTITLQAGSTTTLLDGRTRGINTGPSYTGIELAYEGAVFSPGGPPFADSPSDRYTMRLDAKNFTFNLM
ncbi:MAG: hypothetical protein FWE67_07670, partial [Planctomycetaceae bacterium]|nr:hypothetical protein [Planctomycetaceae bacterium]